MIFILLFITGISMYILFMFQLGHTIGDGPLVGLFEEDFSRHEASEKLFGIMVLVVCVVGSSATVFAYFFAKSTLHPVEQMYRAQEKFVADVAHELRTPLTVLKLGSETTLQGDAQLDSYRSFIEDTRDESDRLITLTNDLLLLMGHSFTSAPRWETVDLSKLIQQQVDFMSVYAKEQDIILDVYIDQNILIRGVESDLSRVALNILRNAIDYSHAGKKVKVKLQQYLSLAQLTITDEGIGIAENDLPNIFNRFYKADTAYVHTQESGGGLGLYLVKEIIDAHQGTILVQSTEGKGTTLTISIPCV
jgi:signal transduction histidine kinase